MKKNKFSLLLSVFALSACSFGSTKSFSWAPYKNNKHAMSLQSSKFNKYKLYDTSKINSNLNALVNEVRNGKDRVKFIQYYNTCSKDLCGLVDSYIVASTKYYAKCDEDYKNKADEYYAYYLNTYKTLTELETDIYHSSEEIKNEYFYGMTDDEILEMLEGNQESIVMAEYDDILTKYTDEAEELYVEYKTTGNKSYYLDKGYDYFLRYINKANELVNETSYDNYLDLAYENDYSRDYSIEDVLPFISYVKQYFVPIAKNKSKLTVPSNVDERLLNAIERDNFCNEATNLSELVSSYAEEMGGQYLSSYNDAFKRGIYCFSSSDKSMTTAFQWKLSLMNDAVLYFSKDYQDALTITHEFGHYYSTHIYNGVRSNDAYDLQETYSQGNEFTFANYLLEQTKNTPEQPTYQFMVDNKLYDSLDYFIEEAAITEIENFAYTTPNLTKEALIAGVNSILDEYEGTASDTYFMGAVIGSPCYYISYATSLIEACQFGAMSFQESKEAYTKLVEDLSPQTMVDRWTNAGLTSPFEETTFQTMAELFTTIASKY